MPPRLFAYLLGACSFGQLMAQGDHAIGALPSVILVRELPKDWSVTGRVETRERLYEEGWEAQHILTDVSVLGGRKLGLNKIFTLGYLYRTGPGVEAHRSIQQFVLVRRAARFRYSHRIVTDQTFTSGKAPILRLRYRLSGEFPLAGSAVDPKEFYVKLNNEYLGTAQAERSGMEGRLAAFVGFAFTSRAKLELGPEHRSFYEAGRTPVHRSWLAITYFLSI